MENHRRRIADNLRELRIEHNYSQEYIGEALNKNDYTAYQRIEHGKAELKFADAYKLAKLYKVPLEHLFDPELRKVELSLAAEPTATYYKRRNFVQMTINLDGTDEFFEEQLDFLRGVNSLIAKKN